jgi:hypothetical protein
MCRLRLVPPVSGLQPQPLVDLVAPPPQGQGCGASTWLSATAPPTPACFPLASQTGRSLDGLGGRQRVNLEEVPSGASAGLTPRAGEEEMPRRRGGGDATASRRCIGKAARPAVQGDYMRTSSLT